MFKIRLLKAKSAKSKSISLLSITFILTALLPLACKTESKENPSLDRAPQSELIKHPEKIGIGTWEVGTSGVSLLNTEQMKFAWYYDWRTTTLWAPGASERTVPFIPMIADASKMSETLPTQMDALLSFNEPDNADMANMTVSEAIAQWPQLMAKNVRLGSPAPTTEEALSDTSWLGRFMIEANARNYRVDFLAIHYYASTKDVNDFRQFLINLHNKYQKPIWITEWALVDWALPNRFTVEEIAAYAREAIIMLDSLDFVEKHAWFSGVEYNVYGPIRTHLFDASNELTPIGEVFEELLLKGEKKPPLPTDPPPAPGSNVLANPGFESGLDSWADWGNSETHSDAHAGSLAARTGVGVGGVAQEVSTHLVAGSTYRIEGFVKVSGGESAWLGLKLHNSSGAVVQDTTEALSGSTYQSVSFDVTIPNGVTSAYVYSWKAVGTGYLHVDELSLKLLEAP